MRQQEVSKKHRPLKKPTVPADIAHLAEIAGLGKWTVSYILTGFTRRGCLFALLFIGLCCAFCVSSVLLAFALISTGLLFLIVGVIASFGLVYLTGKKAWQCHLGEVARVYFYQQGCIYVHEEQQIVLRWEQIERVDIIYGLVRRCSIAFADGGKMILMNGSRSGLAEQIRRRVLRFRKKHQHSSG